MKDSTKKLIIKEIVSSLLGAFIYISLRLNIPIDFNAILDVCLFLISISIGGFLYELAKKYKDKGV